jgi:hypothetical protein
MLVWLHPVTNIVLSFQKFIMSPKSFYNSSKKFTMIPIKVYDNMNN